MKIAIIFDTARLANPEQLQRIEEAPGFDLTLLLRSLVEECERTSDLPQVRELLLGGGEHSPAIGTVYIVRDEAQQQQRKACLWSAYSLSRAERDGNIYTLDKNHMALLARVDVLRDQDLLLMRYHGLLMFLVLVAGTLAECADFLREMAEEGASHV